MPFSQCVFHACLWSISLGRLNWKSFFRTVQTYTAALPQCHCSAVLNPCQQFYNTVLLQVHSMAQPVAYRIMAAAALHGECQCFRSTAATVTHTLHC